jgi:hypothetical protein
MGGACIGGNVRLVDSPGHRYARPPLFRYAGKRVKHLVCNLATKTILNMISLASANLADEIYLIFRFISAKT